MEFSKRVMIRDIVRKKNGLVFCERKRNVSVGGWVKSGTVLQSGHNGSTARFAFVELNDGSCIDNLRVVLDESLGYPLAQLTPTGTCLQVEGVILEDAITMMSPISGKETVQHLRLQVKKVVHLGTADSVKYPISNSSNNQLDRDFLRTVLHLRPRTTLISAITRISSELGDATKEFFRKHGFTQVHTPIITTSDFEGIGKIFQVTTLFSDAEKSGEEALEKNPPPSDADIRAAKLLVEVSARKVKQLKAAKAREELIAAFAAELTKAEEELTILEEGMEQKSSYLPLKDGKIDFSKDFFGCPASLVGSGQLQLETFACALGNVYTFGPTFRAERNNSGRHLAEFWMVEPEMAFANLEDDMNCAEEYVRFLCAWLLDNCMNEMEFMVKHIDEAAIDRLKVVCSTPFARISYTKAVSLLKNVTEKKFENKVKWGLELEAEHERYLTEVIFKQPIIVYNYPKGIKPFCMRLNDDMETVAAMDLLVPKVGELIGGSQREERYDVIVKRMREMGLPLEPYQWYLDLRRFGTCPHSGFGLGFERMILFATGLDNIRDAIPFPRCSGRPEL